MKTLVIAEKPSVARDLADALPGNIRKPRQLPRVGRHRDHLRGRPPRRARSTPRSTTRASRSGAWPTCRSSPRSSGCAPRDTKAKKQLKVIHKLLQRDDVDRVVNACDAGREGELIFAYIYETSGVDKPVERLWISSMTKTAIREGFEQLRPGEQLRQLEAAARSRSEADWLVGMNATRAATIRGRAWVGGVVSLGRVQTPTLAMLVKREREIQAFVPEPYWLVHAEFDPRYEGLWFEGDETRLKEAKRAEEIVDEGLRQGRHRRVGRAQGAVRARAAALRPHLAPARREPPLRLLRAPHAAGRAVALRGQEGDHLSAHELALALRRPRPAAEADRRDAAADRRVRRGRALRARPAAAAARPRRQRREGRRPPRDHPDRRRARRLRGSRPTSGASSTWSPAASWPSSTRRRATRARRSSRSSRRSASARAARSRSRPGWRGVYGLLSEADAGSAEARTRKARTRAPSCRRSSRARRSSAPPPRSRPRRRSRRRATPRRRCSPRWRPPAS